MTTLSGGNLSILDDNGDIWITPSAVDKGNLTPEDIICVHPDGSMEGPHRPSSELPFHRAIYKSRPDFRAVVHAHAPALVSYSIVRKIPDTRIIPQANRVCAPVGYAPYALPGSEKLGENIAATFAQGYNIVILENHGVATGGENLLTAFQRLETLDFCARTLIKAEALGEVKMLSEEQLELFDRRKYMLPEFKLEGHSSYELDLRKQIVQIVHRSCDRYLMISTEGVVSARVDEKSFLITPTGVDRRGVSETDLVLIKDEHREAGKYPSRSVKLHQAIYDNHPDIHCIIMAQSPNIVAFAVTSVQFDSKTIPESYIMLVDVPTVPFEMLYLQPEEVAQNVSSRTPLLVVENDCVLAVGGSVMQAFDRLEVAEFSAKALLDTHAIGTLVPINPQQVEELQEKFLS